MYTFFRSQNPTSILFFHRLNMSRWLWNKVYKHDENVTAPVASLKDYLPTYLRVCGAQFWGFLRDAAVVRVLVVALDTVFVAVVGDARRAGAWRRLAQHGDGWRAGLAWKQNRNNTWRQCSVTLQSQKKILSQVLRVRSEVHPPLLLTQNVKFGGLWISSGSWNSINYDWLNLLIINCHWLI